MKIKFSKREDGEIIVSQADDSGDTPFSYISMIKSLITDGKLDDPDIIGEFSDPEKASIKSMVSFINKEVDALKSDAQPSIVP